MLGAFRTRKSGILIWALMAALIVGLAGFGIGAGTGLGSSSIAKVGGETVDTDAYIRAMQQELRALNAQVGREVPISEARQYGIDQVVLARLVSDAALDDEARKLGLSIGDEALRQRLNAVPAFQGSDGSFSRDAYVYALERINLRPNQFEALLRQEAARDLIANAVQSPALLPATAADTVLGFLGERRTFEWMRLDAGLLPEPIPAPTDADLTAEHTDHADRYTRPETREITYAAVTPTGLAAGISFPDDELRAAYEADIAHYQTPERRVLDRIGFGTTEEAADARRRLDAGEVDFDALATERGLKPDEISQGFVTADSLGPEARDAVFGAAGPGIVGPVATPLGPALYRINAVLGASTRSFDEVKGELATSRALEEAQRRITEQTATIEDLLAGGATAEEIASETDMELGTIALNAETTGGLADDPAFRDAAAAATVGVETDLVELADGGLVTLRVDRIVPPEVIPLDEVRDRVAADWTAEQTAAALTTLADGYATELHGDLDFPALAERIQRPMQVAGPLTRGEVAPNAPAELVADIFAADADGTVIRPDRDTVILAQLREIAPFDPAGDNNATIAQNLRAEFDAQAKDDVLQAYVAALRDTAGVEVNQSLLESTLARFQ